jgi:hypothetical protein
MKFSKPLVEHSLFSVIPMNVLILIALVLLRLVVAGLRLLHMVDTSLEPVALIPKKSSGPSLAVAVRSERAPFNFKLSEWVEVIHSSALDLVVLILGCEGDVRLSNSNIRQGTRLIAALHLTLIT